MDINKTYTVTIIVPFYNQENVVECTINSLLSQDYPKENLNFVFVDDGSIDGTTKILRKFSKDSRIKVIYFSENQGRSASRNAGILSSNSELIGFLDGDMTVEPNWLKLLINKLDDNVVGIMGDNCLPKGVAPNFLDRYFYSLNRGARQIAVNEPLNFRWFLFNNTIVRRSSLKMIGYFDQVFKTYGGEDTDLAIRLWETNPNGLRFSPIAVSEHHHRRELDEFCQSMYQYGKNNLPILIKKYPNYKNDLCGQYINSIRGRVIFNPIIRYIVTKLGFLIENYWLKRYLVVDSVIRGARQA